MDSEAESMLPKIKSWRDVGDTPYRKNHEKRQNFDSSTPPAREKHSHPILNGETRRAPVLPEPAPRPLVKAQTTR
jgi:hypothetical protein